MAECLVAARRVHSRFDDIPSGRPIKMERWKNKKKLGPLTGTIASKEAKTKSTLSLSLSLYFFWTTDALLLTMAMAIAMAMLYGHLKT